MLESGVIRPSRCQWTSSIILDEQPDWASWRFCISYRKLNAVTKKDSYPLSRIAETLDWLAWSKYFSFLDIDQAYHQVE